MPDLVGNPEDRFSRDAAHFYLACCIVDSSLQTFTCKEMSRIMRKPAFCICENKDADQLRGNREAVQRLCFSYTNSTIPLLPKSEISGFWQSSVAAQPSLCRTRSETPKTGFSHNEAQIFFSTLGV